MFSKIRLESDQVKSLYAIGRMETYLLSRQYVSSLLDLSERAFAQRLA